MITAENIRGLIEKDLSVNGFFLVDIQVKPSGKIVVFADSFSGITLDDCISITKLIGGKIGSDMENYELEVSSPGLDNPLKMPAQYRKNAGRMIRVVNTDGEILEGKIKDADEEKFVVEVAEKGKKKVTLPQSVEIEYTNVKTAKLIIR